MRKYLPLTRLYKFILKYGLLKGPYSIICWLIIKIINKRQATKIDTIDYNLFSIKGSSDFENYYNGVFQNDIKMILGGHKKILFYQIKDIYFEKDIKKRW